jgi:nickel-dependent lactate racemase
MEINLAYGKKGKIIHLNDEYNVDVIEPLFIESLKSPEEKIRDSIRKPYNAIPLKDWILPNESVGIVFSDITRPVPLKIILPIILDEISRIDNINITLFNATGTHRENTDEEMREMLGDAIFTKYPIIQNDAFNISTHRNFGKTSKGHEIYINDTLASCDRLILTGFIEPHFFAGFSGGGKAIMPGMAGIQTILNNHGPGMIADPNATFGVTIGNPIWEEINEIGERFPNSFLVNVTLNKNKEITNVFSGNLAEAHAAGCAYVKKKAMVPVKEYYDVVITTNSGYPLDINLYQSVKGMSAAARIIKKDGVIILAVECWDGIPDHGCYGTLLKNASNPGELLVNIMNADEITPDQWQAQIQAQIQLDSDVYVYSDYLSDSDISSCLLLPCNNIEALVNQLTKLHGKDTKICILPEGPQTIPFIQ